MSLLEWLKFWSKSHRIPLFCSNLVQNNPPPPMKIVRESKSECPRIPPQMKIVRESKSEGPRIPPPPNPNFQLFFLSPNPRVPEYPPQAEKPGDRMWRLICNPPGYHSFIHKLHDNLLFSFLIGHWRLNY